MNIYCVINLPESVNKTDLVYSEVIQYCNKNNHIVNFEIVGIDNPDQDLINDAELILVVSDSFYNSNKFNNKNLKVISSDQVSSNLKEIFKINKTGRKIEKNKNKLPEVSVKEGAIKYIKLYSSLRNGAYAVFPLIIIGGIFAIFSYFFGINSPSEGVGCSFLAVSTSTFALVIPILSAFIALSINDKSFSVGLVTGAFASIIGAGFIGGIITGLLSGYLMSLLMKIKIPKSFDGLKSNIIMPVISVFILCFIIIYIGNPLLKYIFDGVFEWVKELNSINYILFGAVIGLFVAFDIGGTVSRATILSIMALSDVSMVVPAAVILAASMVPPLGIGLATIISRNSFNKEEIQSGNISWLLGLCGITEGAIPFIVSDPIKVLPTVMVGSAAAGAITACFGSLANITKGGIFALFSGNAVGIIGIIIGIIVGSIITGILIKNLK